MKVIFISGINYPEFVKEGDMYFTLCDWINENKQYKDFYRKQKEYKITDNMAAENGESSPIKQVLQAARDVNSNEVWASDSLYDKNKTKILTARFIKEMTKEDKKRFRVVGLPQGRNMKEWLNCYKWMLRNKNIDVIALSKYSIEAFAPLAGTKDFAICRIACVKYLHDKGLVKKPLHCAGANPLIIHEIQEYRKYPLVRSIDSNIAFKLGVHRIKIDECTKEPEERLDHNVKDLDKEQLCIIQHNINKIKEAR